MVYCWTTCTAANNQTKARRGDKRQRAIARLDLHDLKACRRCHGNHRLIGRIPVAVGERIFGRSVQTLDFT
jgi:hypothetical protein